MTTSTIHPELSAYFDGQRETQQHLVRTAQVQSSVRQIQVATIALMDKYIARGVQMDENVARAEEVAKQSADFASEAQGINRYFRCICIPVWWFECSPPSESRVVRKRVKVQL